MATTTCERSQKTLSIAVAPKLPQRIKRCLGEWTELKELDRASGDVATLWAGYLRCGQMAGGACDGVAQW